MYKLTIVDDEGKNTVVPLPGGREEFTIGRKEGNTIRLTERNVSRQHARLVRSNGSFYIEDKGSYTGVKVNGDRISGRRHIKEGDEIRIGDYHLSLAVEKTVEKEHKANGSAKNGVSSGTAVIKLDTKQQERLQKGAAPVSSERGRLCLLSGPQAGKMFAIERDEVVIGRTDDNDIVLNHRSISRNHAKIVITGNVYQIVDLGSANGVRVNGEEYGKIDLRKGDKIDLGHVRLRFVGPGEDFAFDPSMKEDVVGGDEKGGGGAGIWVLLLVLLVAGGGAGAYFMGLIPGTGGETKPDNNNPNNSNNLSAVPDNTNPNTSAPTPKNPPPDNAASLLEEAAKLAKEKKWSEAQALAEQAGDSALSEKYFNEDAASLWLAGCKPALDSGSPDDIVQKCLAPLNSNQKIAETTTYQESQTAVGDAKNKIKEALLPEAKTAVENAKRSKKPNDLYIAEDKVKKLRSALGGKDEDVVALSNEVEAVQRQVIGELCKLCTADQTCTAAGKCVDKKDPSVECEKKGGTYTNGKCVMPTVSTGPGDDEKCKADGGTWDAKTKTCVKGSITPPSGKTQEEALDEIESAAVGSDCPTALRLISEFGKTYGSNNSQLFWYKAYCYRDSNPEAACQAYLKFIKLAKGDGRVNQAKQYIGAQDPSMHPACVLPTTP